MKAYRSRISLTLVAFILLVCYGPLLFIPGEGMMPTFVAVTIVVVCVQLCFCGIKYVIDGDVIYISPRRQEEFLEDIKCFSAKMSTKTKNDVFHP